MRHDAACCAALFAVAASIWAALGREATGTGGGTSFEGSAGVPPDVSPLTSGIVLMNLSGGGGRRRAGCAGGDACAPSSPGERAGLLGSRGGRDGRGVLLAWGRAGMDRLGSRGGFDILAVLAARASSLSLAMAASLSRLEGGSGGRLASSSGGGKLRPLVGLWLVVWFRDSADMLEE